MKKERRFLAMLLALAMLVSELQFVRADGPTPAETHIISVVESRAKVNGQDFGDCYAVEVGDSISIPEANWPTTDPIITVQNLDGDEIGHSLNWVVEETAHTLTVPGFGDMDVNPNSNPCCWRLIAGGDGDKINSVTLGAINTEIAFDADSLKGQSIPNVTGAKQTSGTPSRYYYVPRPYSSIRLPALPNTTNQKFVGWKYQFDNGIEEKHNAEKLTDNGKTEYEISTDGYSLKLTLYAQWESKSTPIIITEDQVKTTYKLTYMVDGKEVTGEECGSNPASVEEGTTVELKTPTKENYVFNGWYTDSEMTEGNKVESVTVEQNTTLYGSWTYTGSTYKVGATLKDVKDTYGITGSELVKNLKDNATLKLDVVKQGVGTPREAASKDWKGATWFYAKGAKSLAAGASYDSLSTSEDWKALSGNDVLAAGEYTVALAFDKNQFDKNGDVVEAGAVAVAKLKVEKQPVTLQLSMAKDESTGFLLDEATTFNPAKDLVVKVLDDKEEELPVTVESFTLVNKAGDKIAYDGEVTFTDLEKMKDYQFFIAADSFETEDLKLGEGFTKANYKLAEDSNKIDLVSLSDDVQMKLDEGQYYGKLYTLNDEALENLDFADYFKVGYVEGEDKTEKYDNIGSVRWYVSTETDDKTRQEAAAAYFSGEEKSVKEQLAKLAENPKNLSAGTIWYVTGYNDMLNLSAEKEITISKQPIILVNAEEIKGVKKAGLQKGVGGINADGKYVGKIKVALLDKDDKVVLNEQPENKLDVKDYSGKYTALLGKVEGLGDLTSLLTWTNHSFSEIDFAEIGEKPDFLYGARAIALATPGIGALPQQGEGAPEFDNTIGKLLQSNFELASNQKYSCYMVSDSRTLKMKDMEGQQLYYITTDATKDESGTSGQPNVEKTPEIPKAPVELIGEVKEVKQEDGSVKKVVEFTVNPFYFKEDEEKPKEGLTEQAKKSQEAAKKNRTKKAKWYLQGEEGLLTALKEEEAEPLGAGDIYDGVKFSLDADAYGEVIQINADFGQTKNKKIAWDKMDENFYVVYIPSVVYTGDKLVARDDLKPAAKKGCNGILDVKVFYGDKQLTIGDDYTLSYKNNVNAASSTDKRAPAVIAKGKGIYKGLQTGNACFTILPARFGQVATMQIKNQFVKYGNNKDLEKIIKPTVVNLANKKVNKKCYQIKILEYFIDEETGVIQSRQASGRYAKNDTVRFFDVVAVATEKGSNFITGSICGEDLQPGDNLYDNLDRVDAIGMPKNSKKLKVNGVTKKLDYGTDLRPLNFVNLGTGTAKVGKTTFQLSDPRIDVSLYKDDEFICGKKDWSTTILKDSGTYYIHVGPVMDWIDEKGKHHPEGSLIQYGVVEPTKVKVTIKGKKLGKSHVKLATKNIDWTSKAPVLEFSIDDEKISDSDRKQIRLCYQKTVSEAVEVGDYTYYTGSTSKLEQMPFTIDGKEVLLSDLVGNKLDLSKVDDIGVDLSAPGSYKLIVDADSIDGKWTGTFNQTYKINTINIKKGMVESGAIKIESKTSYAYNPGGHDADSVAVSLKNPEGNYVALEPGIDYSLSWKDSKIATDGGKLTVKGTGKKIKGSYSTYYEVTQADLSKTEPYIEGVTKPEAEKIYYIEYSRSRTSKTVTSQLVQFTKVVDKNGNWSYKKSELKQGSAYTLTIKTESETQSQQDPEIEQSTEPEVVTEECALAEAKSNYYCGSYLMKYKLYDSDISKVTMELAYGGKMYINSEEGRELAQEVMPASEGVGIKITKLTIEYKDKNIAAEIIEGWDKIREACDISYSNNTKANVKATVTIRFKDGTKYPTDKTYTSKFIITVNDETPTATSTGNITN
ncbi:MAG: hypothetical protein E7280_04945 [Lachnospiraceae bacterium]|nr:hypothetical protein [Lachnospiraceae bacterium]